MEPREYISPTGKASILITTEYSVPDQYLARLGAISYSSPIQRFIVFSLRWKIRMDPAIKGSDWREVDGFRRPGYIESQLSLGVNYMIRQNKFFALHSLPIAIVRNRTFKA